MAVLLLCSCGPKNGFVEESGVTYYYLNDEKQIGWQKINNEWYYFYETDYYEGEYKGKGGMKRGTWLKKDGNYYFFDFEGKMLRGDLYKLNDGNLYYFDGNGKMLHDTEITVRGGKYLINSKGVANEAPYYSAPAPMGGTYNFYLKNNFPISLSYLSGASWAKYLGKWIINEVPSIEVFGNSVTLIGIVEYQSTKEINDVNFTCRLSSTDENGITDSVVEYAKSAEIKGGEKTKFEVKFNKSLPLIGRDIIIEFIAND